MQPCLEECRPFVMKALSRETGRSSPDPMLRRIACNLNPGLRTPKTSMKHKSTLPMLPAGARSTAVQPGSRAEQTARDLRSRVVSWQIDVLSAIPLGCAVLDPFSFRAQGAQRAYRSPSRSFAWRALQEARMLRTTLEAHQAPRQVKPQP